MKMINNTDKVAQIKQMIQDVQLKYEQYAALIKSASCQGVAVYEKHGFMQIL